ncbi:hypothetical protein BC834DRAFT_914114 [Gloeopeniophorella convolvens]|nr:hypothetical protein BC834DRAFT_914114 [Gloeopeniophorella convolvens]
MEPDTGTPPGPQNEPPGSEIVLSSQPTQDGVPSNAAPSPTSALTPTIETILENIAQRGKYFAQDIPEDWHTTTSTDRKDWNFANWNSTDILNLLSSISRAATLALPRIHPPSTDESATSARAEIARLSRVLGHYPTYYEIEPAQIFDLEQRLVSTIIDRRLDKDAIRQEFSERERKAPPTREGNQEEVNYRLRDFENTAQADGELEILRHIDVHKGEQILKRKAALDADPDFHRELADMRRRILEEEENKLKISAAFKTKLDKFKRTHFEAALNKIKVDLHEYVKRNQTKFENQVFVDAIQLVQAEKFTLPDAAILKDQDGREITAAAFRQAGVHTALTRETIDWARVMNHAWDDIHPAELADQPIAPTRPPNAKARARQRPNAKDQTQSPLTTRTLTRMRA